MAAKRSGQHPPPDYAALVRRLPNTARVDTVIDDAVQNAQDRGLSEDADPARFWKEVYREVIDSLDAMGIGRSRERVVGPEDALAFGRRVAAAQGIDPDDPSIDWPEYGAAAQYAVGRGRAVPDPERFRLGGPAPARSRAPAAPPPTAGPVVQTTPPRRRGTRIGNIEIEIHAIPEPLAAHRPQWRGPHRRQRTSGRYRDRDLAAAFFAVHDELVEAQEKTRRALRDHGRTSRQYHAAAAAQVECERRYQEVARQLGRERRRGERVARQRWRR